MGQILIPHSHDAPVASSKPIARAARLLAITTLLVALAAIPSQKSDARPASGDLPFTATPSVACSVAAVDAVRLWFRAVSTGDSAAVKRAVSPTFGVISAGRNGRTEPFFRAERMDALLAYVQRRAAKHEHITQVKVPLGALVGSRMMLGTVSYNRTADDITGAEHWLGKGEYECGKGIHILNAAPQ